MGKKACFPGEIDSTKTRDMVESDEQKFKRTNRLRQSGYIKRVQIDTNSSAQTEVKMAKMEMFFQIEQNNLHFNIYGL